MVPPMAISAGFDRFPAPGRFKTRPENGKMGIGKAVRPILARNAHD
jgi:hypothetical protein